MRTNNFSYENCLFVSTDDEYYEGILDDLEDNIREDLNSIKINNGIEINQSDNNRNYGGKYFYEIYTPDNKAKIKLIHRLAYYDGVNFDYEIWTHDDENYYEENIKYINEPLDDETLKQINTIIKRVKRIYRKYLTELNHLGTFSNGEAVYGIKK